MIVSEFVELEVKGGKRRNWLTSLEYDCVIGDTINVRVKDLPSKSDVIVLCRCDDCGALRELKYGTYKAVCEKCTKAKHQFKAGDKHTNWVGGDERFKCIDCGKQLSKGKYSRCKECFGKSNSGDNNYRWLDDRSNMVVRNGNMQRWGNKVKERDNYICQVCGDTESLKEAHHIDSVINHRDDMYKKENGVTLCVECHKTFHKQFGYGYNDSKQWEQFIGGQDGN
jgi:hypothetical protein